jgi:hypothetical protein
MPTALACLAAFCIVIGVSALAAAESWPDETTIESEPCTTTS